MEKKAFKANIFLFLAALVWGVTFVAQRAGMEHLGPFTYSGVRFALGALFLAPLAWRGYKLDSLSPFRPGGKWIVVWGGVLAGLAMAAGINFQQAGLVYTTAGKAGFITGLYVIIVPILGLFWSQRPGLGVWIGAPLAAVGLYFMSVTEGFSLAQGDALVLVCAFAWAGHILVLGWLSPRMNPYVLACGQAAVCSFLSLTIAAFTEDFSLPALWAARVPILWGSVMSVGIGFTLQVLGQKDSPPAHAAIIMQLEAVFAGLSGWLILGEIMSLRAIFGAGLMLAGMLTAQLWAWKRPDRQGLAGGPAAGGPVSISGLENKINSQIIPLS